MNNVSINISLFDNKFKIPKKFTNENFLSILLAILTFDLSIFLKLQSIWFFF